MSRRRIVLNPQRRAGFTLVEVLVALFVMAILAVLSWRGVDTLLRSRDATRDAIDRTMRLNTVLSQWERDLAALQDDGGVLPRQLAFDGRTLRLVRRVDEGVRLVAWSLNGSTWQRWVSAPTTRVGELQQAWLRSLQLQGGEPDQLKLLEGVTSWQLYYYRGNAWTNAQSTGDIAAPPPDPAPSAPAAAPREALPAGVRLVLQFDGKTLTRDIEVPPAR